MKTSNRYFRIIMVLCLSFSFLAVAGYAIADDISLHDQQLILEGGKQMVEGNKKVVDTMTKKGVKDPDLMASQKKMEEGYSMMTKGHSMMNGASKSEGQSMMMKGANMMMDADKLCRANCEKNGMMKECSMHFDESMTGAKKIKGAFQTYGLHGNWESGQ